MQTGPFLSIARHLRAHVDGIKHIDLYNAQYTQRNDRGELPFNRPAVFIEYGNVDWVEQGIGTQEGDTTIALHCVTNMIQDTRNIDLITDDARVASKLKALEFDTLVHEAMQQFLPDDCIRDMWRRREVYDWDHDGLLVTVLIFTTRRREQIQTPGRRYVTVSSVSTSGQLVPQLTQPEDHAALTGQNGQQLLNENGQGLNNNAVTPPPPTA